MDGRRSAIWREDHIDDCIYMISNDGIKIYAMFQHDENLGLLMESMEDDQQIFPRVVQKSQSKKAIIHLPSHSLTRRA